MIQCFVTSFFIQAHSGYTRYLELAARRERQYRAAKKRGLIPGTPEALSILAALDRASIPNSSV